MIELYGLVLVVSWCLFWIYKSTQKPNTTNWDRRIEEEIYIKDGD